MKLSFLALTATLLATTLSFAGENVPVTELPQVLVKSVVSRGNFMPGPGRVHREPSTIFVVEVFACELFQESDYRLEVKNKTLNSVGEGSQFVAEVRIVTDRKDTECEGKNFFNKKVKLLTREIGPHQLVVVKNPVIVEQHFAY